jgi:hypothetical protein
MARERGLAKQVRVGLEERERPMLRLIEGTKDPLETISFGRPVREHVRDFGVLFALIATAIAGFIVWRSGSDAKALSFLLGAAVFFLGGCFAPKALYPLWKAWMAFAEKLSVVMTYLILMLAWCIIVVPMALVLRVVRVKVMNMNFRLNVDSYWEERPTRLHDFKLLERQF